MCVWVFLHRCSKLHLSTAYDFHVMIVCQWQVTLGATQLPRFLLIKTEREKFKKVFERVRCEEPFSGCAMQVRKDFVLRTEQDYAAPHLWQVGVYLSGISKQRSWLHVTLKRFFLKKKKRKKHNGSLNCYFVLATYEDNKLQWHKNKRPVFFSDTHSALAWHLA